MVCGILDYVRVKKGDCLRGLGVDWVGHTIMVFNSLGRNYSLDFSTRRLGSSCRVPVRE